MDLCKNPKPDPECYILTCEKLGVKPEEAIAIEDSDSGVESACSAGIKTVLIPDVMKNSLATKKKAWCILKSLDQLIEII